MTRKGNTKGSVAEEAIRSVFRREGYYVVRGLPYTFKGREVTDIDLWLYGKSGSFRERVNVDIKNKKTPKAIERIFWALGVMQVLKLDRCVVVTTERNSDIVEFGRRCSVAVIDGQYLKDAQATPDTDRLSEETFLRRICHCEAEELGRRFQLRYLTAKSRLLTQMTYDGCNAHLLDARTCMEELLTHPGLRDSIRRILYAIMSYLAVTIDYIINKMQFADSIRRQTAVENGLRYGNVGVQRLEEFSRILEACKNESSKQDNDVITRIVNTLRNGADVLRTDIVAEYLLKELESTGLIELAIQLEVHSFALQCSPIADLPVAPKSFVLMLADFFDIDRKRVIEC